MESFDSANVKWWSANVSPVSTCTAYFLSTALELSAACVVCVICVCVSEKNCRCVLYLTDYIGTVTKYRLALSPFFAVCISENSNIR